MLIIVTGEVGIGKTTVCQKVIGIIESQGYTCGGIITYKAPNGGITIEDIQTGERMTLASCREVYQGPHVGKYWFNPEGIDFGIQAIERGASATVLVVDELGYLELRGESFINAIQMIEAGNVKNAVLVIRQELLHAFLSRLKQTPLIFETTFGNRAKLPEEIGLVLTQSIGAYAS